jgi:hypothetical protein
VKIPPAPFGKGGDILDFAQGGDIWGFTKGGDIWGILWPDEIPPAPFGKGGDILAFAKEGDILRLFSDRMPARIACRQVSENSRTFPPFEKGGSGGISHEKGVARGGIAIFYIPGPLHHRFRFYHYLTAVKIPPAPFGKGGDILAFGKGEDIWGFLWPIVKSPRPPLVKGEIFWPLVKGEIFWPLRKGEIF